ncbi:MAG: hypothetical protein NC827_05365 [Candidatus Omnitrophica bacterium]|nr:hypothetical protein [Candidatus Omnitrophota bacterium]
MFFPNLRKAYYSNEEIEISLTDIRDEKIKIEIIPTIDQQKPVNIDLNIKDKSVSLKFPPYSFSPGKYIILINGVKKGELIVSSGIIDSETFVSQVDNIERLKEGGGNFIVGNAFSFGIIDDGKPSLDVRRKTFNLNYFEKAIENNLPTLIYMYWTGYVTHKPWGTRKSWAANDMQELMRLFSFSVAQRLKRYEKNISSIGTIDEPGLNWGKTPCGGYSSGFPSWDEEEWYKVRSWEFTDNPAERDDNDFLKYMRIRCNIIGETLLQAKKDIKKILPNISFESDVYVGHIICDGAEIMNQEVNDFPTTHIFLDWWIGRDGTQTQIYIEKANKPEANVAHAMNGQLMGKKVPQPQHKYVYHLMMNGLLQAGLKSNWWLNWGGMERKDLAEVNLPAKKYGPFIGKLIPEHKIGVLWSFRELSLREKEILKREATKKQGEQIRLMVATWEEGEKIKESELSINAYTVANNYRTQISFIHNALLRAGYPADIIHEEVLKKYIEKYEVLFIVGQTYPLSEEVNKTIERWVRKGGKIIVDKSSTIKFNFPVYNLNIDLKDVGYKWALMFEMASNKKFSTPKENSYYLTNYFTNLPIINLVKYVKDIMKKVGIEPVIETDSEYLITEKRVGKDGYVIMILNAFQKLPDISESEEYYIWNYSPYTKDIKINEKKKGVFFLIEGLDWNKIREIKDYKNKINLSFEPCEMKLLYFIKNQPKDFKIDCNIIEGKLFIKAQIENLKIPCPFTLKIISPEGREIYNVYRSTDQNGKYEEIFPIGKNNKNGIYKVVIESGIGNIKKEKNVEYKSGNVNFEFIKDVRIFEQEKIKEFFKNKKDIKIVVSEKYIPLAKMLNEKLGEKFDILNEKEILKKVKYPRIWDPYCYIYRNKGEEKKVEGKIEREVSLEITSEGEIRAITKDGKDLKDEWKKPLTLVTIVGQGYIDYLGLDTEEIYEPGCKFYIDEKGRKIVIKGEKEEIKTTKEIREKWSKEWTKIYSYNGGYQCPPQLPECYFSEYDMIIFGNSKDSEIVRILQASEITRQVVDEKYPGEGKCLIMYLHSPFNIEKDVVFIGGSDIEGLKRGINEIISLIKKGERK